MPKPLIVANWKMNPITLREAKLLFDTVEKGIKNVKKAEVVICPPFLYISNLKSQISNLKLGGQDCFWEQKGAFTGEISPAMLKSLACQYVILGHSERRKYLGETKEMINKKIKAALRVGLKPILCIDNLSQIPRGLNKNLIIAYEPLFAIGTGKACSPEKAGKMRNALDGFKTVLYGGSVDAKNAKDYLEIASFQGLLVGGASLKAQEFINIVKNISKD